MEQVKHFIIHIFGSESWPARWFCGNWSDFHGWLYICSSLAIWAAYFAIPLTLMCLLAKRKDSIPFQGIFWLFILFILSCGLTHLVDTVIFWLPVYRVSAFVLFFTAIISWIIPQSVRRSCRRENKSTSYCK
jgi:chemotaxis family two-component system sensor kinase Cph1